MKANFEEEFWIIRPKDTRHEKARKYLCRRNNNKGVEKAAKETGSLEKRPLKRKHKKIDPVKLFTSKRTF